MQIDDVANKYLSHTPIVGVEFEHNEAVQIVSGEHAVEAGSLVTIVSLGEDPSYILELGSGLDVVVRQSQLRRVRHQGETYMAPMTTKAQDCFIVLYRWRLHPGTEDAFVQGWSRITGLLRAHGSLGSRLHCGSDGLWYSYAQWPSAQVREDIFALGALDENASAMMKSAIAESFPEITLNARADYLAALRQDDA